MDFSGPDDKTPGSIIFDMKMEYYYQDYPILTCLELDGKKRVQVFYMSDGMFNLIDEKENSYQNVCLMTRTLDRKWWSIDMQGNIYHSIANIPKQRSPKKNQVRTGSPNALRFSPYLNEASFINKDPGHRFESLEPGHVSNRNQRFAFNRRRNAQRNPVRVSEVIYDQYGSPFNDRKVSAFDPNNSMYDSRNVVLTPEYTTEQMRFMNRNSGQRKNQRIDPIIEGGSQANDPIYYSPTSDYKPWNN